MADNFLDLKYRPKTFDGVIGNEGPVAVLRKRSINKVLLNRSILLGGPKGCGKTSLARIIARATTCVNIENGNPCNSCASCSDILNENSSSVYEFDAAAHGTVDRIRSIVDGLDYENFDGNPTILILDEAHRLSPASQDALLKSLEDRRIFCIMCTTEPNKIRPAIRDRLDEYAIRPSSSDSVINLLKYICENESISYDLSALQEIVINCDRSPRSSINTLQSIVFSDGLSLTAVRKHFRYDNQAIICESLKLLLDKASHCLQEMSPVFESESPAWIRDTIVKIISTSIRKALSINTPSHVPVIAMDPSYINYWSSIAKDLSLVEKITIYDIEMVLINSVKHVSSVSHPAYHPVSQVIPKITKEEAKPLEVPAYLYNRKKSEKPTIKPSKHLEIDGVKFSSEENLTSIDTKIGSSRGPNLEEKAGTPVEYEIDKVPMSEQEFSRAFFEKFSSSR